MLFPIVPEFIQTMGFCFYNNLFYYYKLIIFTFIMAKKNQTTISIALDPAILKKLEEGKYNKSKLIDSLLDSYFRNQKKK